MTDAYHLALGGQSAGPFTLEQVRGMWQTGRVTAATLFWRPGDPAWQPLGEIAFALGSTPPPMPPVAGYYPPPMWMNDRPVNSGVAVASFVLGLSSILLFITFLPAIICGHVALSQIKHSGGRLTGRGFAIAGLLLGYAWIGFIGLAFVAGLALPIFNLTSSRGKEVRELVQAKQVGLAIKLYEGDHDGKTPPRLEDLFDTYLQDRSVLRSRLSETHESPAVELMEPDTKVDTLDPHAVLLRGRFTSENGKRVYVYNDNSGELKNDP